MFSRTILIPTTTSTAVARPSAHVSHAVPCARQTASTRITPTVERTAVRPVMVSWSAVDRHHGEHGLEHLIIGHVEVVDVIRVCRPSQPVVAHHGENRLSARLIEAVRKHRLHDRHDLGRQAPRGNRPCGEYRIRRERDDEGDGDLEDRVAPRIFGLLLLGPAPPKILAPARYSSPAAPDFGQRVELMLRWHKAAIYGSCSVE